MSWWETCYLVVSRRDAGPRPVECYSCLLWMRMISAVVIIFIPFVPLVLPWFATVPVSESSLIGLPVVIIFEFVIFMLVFLTVFPALLVIFVAYIVAVIAVLHVVMVAVLIVILHVPMIAVLIAHLIAPLVLLCLLIAMVIILRNSRNCRSAAQRHEQCQRS